MNAIALGPLVFSAERLSFLIGLAIFFLISALVTRRLQAPWRDRFSSWSWIALITGIVAARAGHVILHWDSFAPEILRSLALWQGGFHTPSGIVAALITILVVLRPTHLRILAAGSVLGGFFVFFALSQLTSQVPTVPPPDKTFATLSGEAYRFDVTDPDKPRAKVVNLWATWCPPCRREMPMMADVAQHRDDVDFVFANQGEGIDAIRDYLRQSNLVFEHILLDPFSEIGRHYATRGLPTTLFINADGTLKHVHVGEISREILHARIDRLQ